jgi:hypothetical protein
MATTKKTQKKANKVTDTSYDRFSAGDGAFGKPNTPCKYFTGKSASKKGK